MSTFLQEDECLLKLGQQSENAQFCFGFFLNQHLLAIYGLSCPNRKNLNYQYALSFRPSKATPTAFQPGLEQVLSGGRTALRLLNKPQPT